MKTFCAMETPLVDILDVRKNSIDSTVNSTMSELYHEVSNDTITELTEFHALSFYY